MYMYYQFRFNILLFVVHIDLTITTEKLVELFRTVNEQRSDDIEQDMDDIELEVDVIELRVDAIGRRLDLPYSKREEVKGNYQSLTQRRDAYLDFYVSDHPYPSWKTVANLLHHVGLPRQADLVERTYVQGMVITPPTVLGIIPTSVCDCIAVTVCFPYQCMF